MLKKLIPFVFFLLTIGTVYASAIEVTLEKEKIEANLGELKEVKVTVKNNQEFRDSFSLSVWPPTYVSLEKDYVVLNPGESKTIEMRILPSLLAETGTKQYTFVVISSSNPKVMAKKNFYVRIERRSGVYISSFSIERGIVIPGEQIILRTIVENLDSVKHGNMTVEVLLKKDGKIIRKDTKKLDVILGNEVKTFLTVFNTSKYTPSGEYTILCLLKDEKDRVIDAKSQTLTIVGVKKIVKEKKIDYGLFHHTVTITLTNEGNEKVEGYAIFESMPKFMKDMVYPSVKPTDVKVSDNKVSYEWVIPAIEPGERVVISYELRFFNMFVLTIIVIGLILVGTFYRMTPKVEKRFKERVVKKERFITITLHVKNRFIRTIRDVTVEDVVPPLLTLVKYFESLKPKIKTTRNGIKLVWNLGSLKPGEERILVYRVKPMVEIIGKLKLPKAVMKYKGVTGRKKEVISKSVEIVSVERKKIL